MNFLYKQRPVMNSVLISLGSCFCPAGFTQNGVSDSSVSSLKDPILQMRHVWTAADMHFCVLPKAQSLEYLPLS
jgi:hypothetical protein